MAGAVQVSASNKIVRRGAQAITIEAKLAAASATSSTGSSAPTTDITTPAGIIAMWGGLLADIPAGWILCDGTNGTPDLRSQFIKGAAPATDPGATGGATTHTPAGSIAAHSTASDTAVTGAGLRVTSATHTFVGTLANFEPAFYSLAFIQKQA